MTEDDIIFDDVYELCEVISKYVFAISDLINFLFMEFVLICYSEVHYDSTWTVLFEWKFSSL